MIFYHLRQLLHSRIQYFMSCSSYTISRPSLSFPGEVAIGQLGKHASESMKYYDSYARDYLQRFTSESRDRYEREVKGRVRSRSPSPARPPPPQRVPPSIWIGTLAELHNDRCVRHSLLHLSTCITHVLTFTTPVCLPEHICGTIGFCAC